MEALKAGRRGIDNVAAGLHVGVGSVHVGVVVVITTTIVVTGRNSRHDPGLPRLLFKWRVDKR